MRKDLRRKIISVEKEGFSSDHNLSFEMLFHRVLSTINCTLVFSLVMLRLSQFEDRYHSTHDISMNIFIVEMHQVHRDIVIGCTEFLSFEERRIFIFYFNSRWHRDSVARMAMPRFFSSSLVKRTWSDCDPEVSLPSELVTYSLLRRINSFCIYVYRYCCICLCMCMCVCRSNEDRISILVESPRPCANSSPSELVLVGMKSHGLDDKQNPFSPPPRETLFALGIYYPIETDRVPLFWSVTISWHGVVHNAL